MVIPLIDEIRPTADYVARIAASDPSKIAINDGDLSVSYAQFSADIEKFIIAAQRFKLTAGQTAAVEWTALYEHWLFLLAFEALGITTISFTKGEIFQYWSDYDDIDLALCRDQKSLIKADQTQIISPEWLKSIFATTTNDSFKYTPLAPETVVRIHCSSGTTGSVKRMRRTAKMHEVRIGQFQYAEGYDPKSRFLFHNSFSVHAAYGRATACLRMGGRCIIADRKIFYEIIKNRITHICIMPVVIKEILLKIPRAYRRPKNLSVLTFGGPLAKSERDYILKNFATNIVESYGTNEIGFATVTNPDGSSTILPDVTVEVVDGKDKPVIGEEGHVRIKSDATVEGYIDDSEATRQMFKFGWFYPGDIGIMSDAKTLTLLGRTDDLINVGGVKVNPHKLEQMIKRNISAKEVILSALKNRYGVPQIWIAITPNKSMTLKEIQKIITPIMPSYLGSINYVKINNMPRTETGKIQRAKIPEEISRILAKRSKPKQASPDHA